MVVFIGLFFSLWLSELPFDIRKSRKKLLLLFSLYTLYFSIVFTFINGVYVRACVVYNAHL